MNSKYNIIDNNIHKKRIINIENQIYFSNYYT